MSIFTHPDSKSKEGFKQPATRLVRWFVWGLWTGMVSHEQLLLATARGTWTRAVPAPDLPSARDMPNVPFGPILVALVGHRKTQKVCPSSWRPYCTVAPENWDDSVCWAALRE